MADYIRVIFYLIGRTNIGKHGSFRRHRSEEYTAVYTPVKYMYANSEKQNVYPTKDGSRINFEYGKDNRF